MNDRMVNLILITAILMLVALLGNMSMLFAISFPVLMFSWMYLGALKRGGIGRGYRGALISVLVLWLFGFIVLNLINHNVAPASYTGGFTPGTAVMVYVIWFLPLIFGTFRYGYHFDSDCINDTELSKIEEIFR